ncbi:MAG: hypothetical protein KUA43_20400 [Hoeflea sp.]|uniref:hypothetical protein n=1 Tax=Hoeflea sp. TaxID=1940281 RepID=UPI001DDC0A76|nr:hypothetical protein [Hoeflea sp.]MBU4528179.1 hypothetical protein [Alphaproteobacteria bacterium]MBU4543775.1 hypothetical protein [Alphaproteobacteria bacterium]MBU4548642.1 hypothetical protein [Alphaproteobacteria bacterium]MBV1725808.1 hypothetical protein [Hoeflea sp.]MBV1762164.1 hypothetical protein [Hoeflea sp.]
MNKMTLTATLALAALLSFASAPAFAETVETQASLCAKAPAKAAKAGIDCTTTSGILNVQDKAAKKYPAGPVNFGNGVVF